MASRTAEGFYVTLVNGVQYLSDYFKYTGKENLLNEIKVKTLGTRMIEGFYGHVTEKNPGNNPTVLQFSKRVATEAFHFVIPAVTSDNTMCQNVSVRRTRDEVSSTYTYAAVGSDDNETSSDAMWAMFQQRHEHCFTTEDLRKVKTNLENGKDIDPALLKKQLYIGRMAFCRGYVSMLGCKGNLTDDQKAKLRGIHMATKSRPMKTLRDFQKRKYGTPPTIIGQHATRRPLNATPIQDSIFTPSTTPQEDAVAVAAVHDQDDVSSYVNSNAFEVGEVVAFRGTDGLPFNLLRVTHNVSLRSLGPRSRVRGDFPVETARDDVNICYSLDLNWKNASMRYAHVLRDGNDGVVTLFLEEAVTVTETKFLMTTETYGEILEIAEQFEDSIKRALQSDELHEDVCEERSTAGTETCTEVAEPSESDHEAQETVVCQDRRQRRGRGNRYQDIIACLR